MAEEHKGFEDTLKDITTDIKRILTNRAVVLKGAYERDIIYYKVMESTLRGGAGQQERIMKEKDKRIEKLEAQVKELQGWSFEKIIDKIYGDYNLESPTGRGMIKYPFINPL